MTEAPGRGFRLRIEDGIAFLRLDRPHSLNALSEALVDELLETVTALGADRSLRVLVLSGAGRAFCAGADLEDSLRTLREIDDGSFSPSGARRVAEQGRRLLDAIEDLPAVSVALVHGVAVGAGVSLAAACDLRVLADDARLQLPEIELGLPLAWGATARLLRDLGPSTVRALLLTGAPLSAADAVGRGFALAAVPAAELDGYGRTLAQRLAGYPAYAMTVTKQRVTALARAASGAEHAPGEADALVAALGETETLDAIRRRLTAVLDRSR